MGNGDEGGQPVGPPPAQRGRVVRVPQAELPERVRVAVQPAASACTAWDGRDAPVRPDEDAQPLGRVALGRHRRPRLQGEPEQHQVRLGETHFDLGQPVDAGSLGQGAGNAGGVGEHLGVVDHAGRIVPAAPARAAPPLRPKVGARPGGFGSGHTGRHERVDGAGCRPREVALTVPAEVTVPPAKLRPSASATGWAGAAGKGSPNSWCQIAIALR